MREKARTEAVAARRSPSIGAPTSTNCCARVPMRWRPSLMERSPWRADRIAGFERSSARMTILARRSSAIAHTLHVGDTGVMICLLRALYYTVAAIGVALFLLSLPAIVSRFAAAPHVLLLLAAIGVVLYFPLKAIARPNPWRRSWWR